tara:strand:- start:372 stop:761 length:390 start_codon:yes stop_codon:yes gene_type:complete
MTDYENKQHIALEKLLKEEGYSPSQKGEAHLIITLSNKFAEMFPEYECALKPLDDKLKNKTGATLIFNIVKTAKITGKKKKARKNKNKYMITGGKLMYSYLCFTDSQKENYGGIMPLDHKSLMAASSRE